MSDNETTRLNRIIYSVGNVVGFIIFALPISCLILCGPGILIYQLYIYLKNGAWLSLSMIDGLVWTGRLSWAKNPTDWLGLHKVLDSTPLSLGLFLIGIALLICFRVETKGLGQ